MKKNMSHYNKRNSRMKAITKKILMLFVLLLGTQEVSRAGMGAQVGRGLGGVTAVGGLGVMAYEGWNFWQAVEKVMEDRDAKGLETDLTDFDTVKEICSLAFKNKHVSKQKLALGGALLVGGVATAGLSHRSIVNKRVYDAKVEGERVAAHKRLVEEGNLFESSEEVKFTDPNSANETNIKKLKAIKDKLEAVGKKTVINLADIEFLKKQVDGQVLAQKTYDKFKRLIDAHNKEADTTEKEAAIEKWKKFITEEVNDNSIGLTQDILNYHGLLVTPENYQAWSVENHNEALLKYLWTNNLTQLVRFSNGTPRKLIKVERHQQLESTDNAIYKAFILAVRESNKQYLEEKITTQKQTMDLNAGQPDCNSNPFLSWQALLREIVPSIGDFVGVQGHYLADDVFNELQAHYEHYLRCKAIAKGRELGLLDNYGTLTNLGDLCAFDRNIAALDWMYLPQDTTFKDRSAGYKQNRQIYDMLKKIDGECYFLSDDGKKEVLRQMKEWYQLDTINLDLARQKFDEVLELAEVIGFTQAEPEHFRKTLMNTLHEFASKCFSSDSQVVIGSAFEVIKSECQIFNNYNNDYDLDGEGKRIMKMVSVAHVLGKETPLPGKHEEEGRGKKIKASVTFERSKAAGWIESLGYVAAKSNLIGSVLSYHHWMWIDPKSEINLGKLVPMKPIAKAS
jgi:hypothetical protein